jgi:hypothetical protein
VSDEPRTNAEIRKWYLKEVGLIHEFNKQWFAKGLSARERAKKAWRIRHDARLKARAMMADPEEVQMLQTRDIVEYGSPDGPSFEFLVRQCQEAGLKGNAVYEAIIKGSYRPNKGVNDKFGL